MIRLLKLLILQLLFTLKRKIFYLSFICLILFRSVFVAQDGIEYTVSNSQISLQQGVEIYSSDAFFNQQILENKITLENSSFILLENSETLKLTAQSIALTLPKKNVKKYKKWVDLKSTSKSKTVKITLNNFNQDYCANNNKTTDFNIFICSGRDCLVVVNSQIQKVFAENILILKHSGGYLKDKKFCCYKKRDHRSSFTKAYSVRPPPIFFSIY
ncbi:hypothetical protein [Chryseobacterium sp. RLHN22]|uniref:hypothetical protein n=1 Tax=Chryseobacterium sp. RLHN22 TaxID=3437885 RepID=UPI003D9AFDCA